MFDIMSGMFCLVTASVSLIYGTRIAWISGRKCDFKTDPNNKLHIVLESIPAATAVYFFGFIIIFAYFIDGPLTIFVSSLTSAILTAGFVVSMAMPELKRKPDEKRQIK